MRIRQSMRFVFNPDGWLTAGHDLVAGFLATLRLSVGTLGALTLVVLGALVVSPEARDGASRLLPTASAEAPSATSPAVADADASDATDEADSPAPVVLDKQLSNVSVYLSRRYHVADDAVRQLVAAAQGAGHDHRVDPLLVVAVMAIESGLNPFAQSPVGAQGLMQVMTSVHAEKFEEHGANGAALDPAANIEVGTAILADGIHRAGSIDGGLQLYLGANNPGDAVGYISRVHGELQRLKLAASGKIEAALALGLRADSGKLGSPAPVTADATQPAA